MSVDNIYDKSILTRAPYEIPKPSYQPDTDTSSSSKYTPRTSSTSTIFSSDALPSTLTSSFKIHNRIESMQEGVHNMHPGRTYP